MPEDTPTEEQTSVSKEQQHHHTGDSQPHQYTVKTLLSWSAPGRPYKKRTKQYFISVLLIMLLVDVILFLFSEYVLMTVTASIVFVLFALALVPPHPYRYRISTEGITFEDHFYLWQELYDFYFRRQHDQDILILRTKAYFPGELSMMLGTMHKDHVKDILVNYLPYREVIHETFIEKSGNWLAKTFPLERSSS